MIKRTLFASSLALAFAISSHASDFQFKVGSGFSAPNVSGYGNVGNPQAGDIIYDTYNHAFMGYGGSTWGVLGVALTAPSVQKFTSSSGTYTTPTSPAPLYIRVRMVGGGGGGGGSSNDSTGGGAGGAGGTTTFGTSLLIANGGSGGGSGSSIPAGGSGGTASLGSGPIGTAVSGISGQNGSATNSVAGLYMVGGQGGASPFASYGDGGAGAGSPASTGSGGRSGAGGGGGGFIDAIITSPAATYSYAVGAAGSAGSAGSSGSAGGVGSSGYIEVTEYYQ